MTSSASLVVQDNGGETALDYAVTCDYDEVISLLVSHPLTSQPCFCNDCVD